MQEILEKLQNLDCIYVAPHIPIDKLYNALSTYAMGVKKNDVLILLDDTVMGSAKDGMLVTKDCIYIKEMFERGKIYKFSSIKTIYIQKNLLSVNVFINNQKVFNPTQPSYSSMQILCDGLNQLLKNNAKKTDSIESKSSQSSELLVNISGDNLYNSLQILKPIFNIKNYPNNIVLNNEIDSKEKQKNIIKNYILQSVKRVRQRHIQAHNITQLENDIATFEILIFSIANLALELRMRNIANDRIYFLLFESLCTLLGYERKEEILYLISRACSVESLRDVAECLYVFLFISNKKGSIIMSANPSIYDFMDLIYNDKNLLYTLKGSSDISELSTEELDRFLVFQIIYYMSEKMGYINEYAQAKECVDKLEL